MGGVRGSTVLSIAVYTILRLALFGVLWFAVAMLTPLSPLWSAVAAVLISGALSVVLLDRQRGAMAQSVGGFFERINSRIERSASAEDAADDLARSGEGEQRADEKPEGQEQ